MRILPEYLFSLLFIFLTLTSGYSQSNNFHFENKCIKQSNWKQQVNSSISVTLDERPQLLRGQIKIEYINNSPDDLTEIWINLWPNAYKNDETPFATQMVENGKTSFYYSSDSSRGFIDSIDFTVNGIQADFKYNLAGDYGYLKLNTPLKSGEYCIIKTPFRVKIPYAFSRMGFAEQVYQFTQWYPKVAAYDIRGWHPMSYLDQGEFYADFGKFRVEITVPDSFILATSGSVAGKVNNGNGYTCYTFLEDNIHDFAWFASKYFYTDTESVILPSGNKVLLSYYATHKADLNIYALKKSVLFADKYIGSYPYSHISVVSGPIRAGGGMEYPCVAVIDGHDNDVIRHEVGHNWFYGMIATDERNFPWMDEGLNTYYDIRFADDSYNTVNPNNQFFTPSFKYNNAEQNQHLIYQFQAMEHLNQPIGLTAPDFTWLNYTAMVYAKTGLSFKYLEVCLGRSVFDSAIHTYYNNWKYKHPLPCDLREVFETISNKNLSWFFDTLIHTNANIDYLIRGVYKDNSRPGYWFVDVENKGTIGAPLILGSKISPMGETYNLKIYDGFYGVKTFAVKDSLANWIVIDPNGVSPEIIRNNNQIKTNKFLRKFEPVRLKPILSFDNFYINEIYYVPIFAYNQYDKCLLGLGFYNESVELKNLSWSLFPMYSFYNQKFSGISTVKKIFFFDNELTQSVELRGTARLFTINDSNNNTTQFKNRYRRLSLTARINFKKSSPRSSIESYFQSSYINILQFSNNRYSEKSGFLINEYKRNNHRTINPYNITGGVLIHKNFQKFYFDVSGSFNLYRPNRKIYYRWFSAFLYYNKIFFPEGINARYYLKPEGNNGFWDYTLDNYTFTRDLNNSGFLSQQIISRDGNLKTPFHFGYTSDTWITSAGLRLPLPAKIPVDIFTDFCFFNKLSFDVSANELVRTPSFAHVSGLALIIFRDVAEVYFPLYLSKSMRNALFYKDASYLSKVSFLLNISSLNPFLYRRTLLNKIH